MRSPSREIPGVEMSGIARAAGEISTPRQVIAAIKACSNLNRIDSGRIIHSQLLHDRSGMIHRDVCIATAILDMYAKCGCLDEAMDVFEGMRCCRSVVTWNCIIWGCAAACEFDRALELYSRMDCSPNHVTFLAALKACIGLAEREARNGKRGEQEQSQGAGSDEDKGGGGQEEDGGKTRCGLAGNDRQGDVGKYDFREPGGGKDDHSVTEFHSLKKVRELHRDADRGGIHLFVANSLITAYSKCGCLGEAWEVFRGMKEHSVISWTEIIMGYAGNGGGKFALELYDRMLEQGFCPSRVTLLAALKACCCSSLAESRGFCLERGKGIHFRAARDGYDSGVMVASSLVDMYSNCGKLVDAFVVFTSMVDPTVISWNCVVMGNVYGGNPGLALQLYEQMVEQGFKPDAATFVAALKACIRLAEKEQGTLVDGRKVVKAKSLATGKEIHCRAAATGDGSGLHIFVANGLIDMYAKCGSMTDAWKVFKSMPTRSLVSWNCVIFGFAASGDGNRAMELYQSMQDEGPSPNHVTYLPVLKACVSIMEDEEVHLSDDSKRVKLECLDKVRAIHLRAGCQVLQHRHLANAMIAAYAKSGGIVNAREVFESLGRQHRDLVSWNSIIAGYGEGGDGNEALELYGRMEDEGFAPDDLTFVAVLKACSSMVQDDKRDENILLLERVRGIRQRAAAGREGRLSTFVCNILIDFYSKCGIVAEALKLFESMDDRSIVSWNCIILGLEANGLSKQAVDLYARLHDEGFTLDIVTFTAALKASASLGDLEAGGKIRLEIVAAGLENSAAIANSLVDFYGKCGSMADAVDVFESMRKRSTVSWNALMDGYRRQGYYERVLEVFDRMKELHFWPDETTFLLVLTACCYCGMVDEGKEVFEAMSGTYGMCPGLKHYNCVVDLLGRANRLDEAVRVLEGMRVEATPVIWMTLLGACWKWKNVKVGEFAFQLVLGRLENDSELYATASVMMSSIYADPV